MKLLKLYFSNFKYERLGLLASENIEPKMERAAKCFKNTTDENVFKLVIEQHIEFKDYYRIDIELSGIFEIQYNGDKEKNMRIRDGLMMMMPYIRSQVTLLTSQPDINPYILPLVKVDFVDGKESIKDILDNFEQVK